MSESGYILKNANAVASTRLDVLASIFDPWTRAHLDARGLSVGWRCWEVGAGGPSTVRWLAERVGPTGHVLATDLDPAGRLRPSARTCQCWRTTSPKRLPKAGST